MFVESYFEKAIHLFEVYRLQMPLHLFLKEFFKNNRKLGSRDRKIIAELLYGAYRIGADAKHIELRTRMVLGAFLSNKLPDIFFEKTIPLLLSYKSKTFQEKWNFVHGHIELGANLNFRWSGDLDTTSFIEYLYAPTKVFIRLRKDPHQIKAKLLKASISFEQIDQQCFALSANTPISEFLEENEYVVQDLASQKVGTFFNPKKGQSWWDCCCASGGKSIMLLDKCQHIHLTVSDIRPSIFINLQLRMKRYGFQHHYKAITADVSQEIEVLKDVEFDHIICDVPCTGSGTWSRSPEQFYYFDATKLQEFCKVQMKIFKQAWSCLKLGGILYYITCSVFKEENEDAIEEFLKQNKAKLLDQKVLSGAKQGGDCLFISVIEKLAI